MQFAAFELHLLLEVLLVNEVDASLASALGAASPYLSIFEAWPIPSLSCPSIARNVASILICLASAIVVPLFRFPIGIFFETFALQPESARLHEIKLIRISERTLLIILASKALETLIVRVLLLCGGKPTYIIITTTLELG